MSDLLALAESERRHHNEEAEEYARRVEQAHVFHVAEARLFLPLLEADTRPNRVVLDVGCGPAISIRRFLGEAIRPGDRYVGVDIAERMLDIARDNVPGGTFVRHDLQTLRLQPDSVDVLLSLGALHHVPDPLTVLDELAGALRPGGIMLLREPTNRAFRRGEGESPVEEGIDVAAFRRLLAGRACTVLSETYLTSWVSIKLRHYLERAHLQGWERLEWPWRVKLGVELALDRTVGERLPRLLRGLDVYLAVQRRPDGDLVPDWPQRSLLGGVIACPECGGALTGDDDVQSCAACGCGLRCHAGIWSFDGVAR